MQWLRKNARLRLFLTFLLMSTTVMSTNTQAEDPPPASTTASAEETTIDLSDPQVRARLRAAGVNPDELLLLLKAQKGGKTPLGSAAPTSPQAFPPVPPPPGAQAVVVDSLAPVDSTGVEASKYFGYDIFRLSPKTFEPLAFGPVSSDYLVGPGDEVIVNVWGAQEVYAKVEVNREGYLFLPDLGQVLVNGYTLEGLKSHLEQRLSKIYSGIRADGTGRTFLDVTLGKLRSIQVFVLGDVVQPGGYTMSATSTAMNALYYAGGPTLQGSMRNARLLRNNKLVQEIDLYNYLAQGDRMQDTRLENGDVVFVPPVGIRVQLEGEIHHPAIFELRSGDTLADLLALAGGLKSTADLDRVQVERVIPFHERTPMSQEDRRILDLSLRTDSGRPGDGTVLVNGDVVRVFAIGEILKNTVELVGTAAYKPGRYEFRPGMTVADLIDAAGGLLGDAYLGWAHLVRTKTDKTREIISFDMKAALRRDAAANQELQALDQVQVFSVGDMRDKRYVRIEGLVRKPGRFEYFEGMTVTDLVLQAGGLRESAYRMRAEVSRIDPEAISEGKTATLIQVSMSDSTTMNEAEVFKLQKNDIVFIREIPNWGLQENVWVTGEVKFPGMYTLTSKLERLSSVITRAGGLETTAYLGGANFIRKKDETGRMALDFGEALKPRKKGYSKYDMVMASGDSIHIPREPKTVKVEGAVGYPSSVLWEKGRDVDYYIEQAGGLLDTADGGAVRIIMANGRVGSRGWFSSPEPDQGARIIVPTKPEKKDTETLKTFATIVGIVTSAATTIYLISQTTD